MSRNAQNSWGSRTLRSLFTGKLLWNNVAPFFYDVTSRTLRLRAAASLLTGERDGAAATLYWPVALSYARPQ